MPCPEDEPCGQWGDRVSASLISAAYPHTFAPSASGFIANPSVAQLLCAWAVDGGTDVRTCSPRGAHDGCVPGCSSTGVNGEPSWCADDAASAGSAWSWCPWRPEQLANMVLQHERWWQAQGLECETGCRYNEVRVQATQLFCVVTDQST